MRPWKKGMLPNLAENGPWERLIDFGLGDDPVLAVALNFVG